MTGPLVPVGMLNLIRGVLGIHHHRFNLSVKRSSGGAGNIWPWIAAALAALGALGLLIGYQRSEHASTQSSPPTTTGSAPSQSRPAPPAKFGDMPAAPAPAPNQ